MWDYSLVFVFSQCSPLLIASLINLHQIRFNTIQNMIASLLSIIIVFAIITSLAIIILGLKRSSEKLNSLNNEFRESGKYWRWYGLLRQCITLVILVEGKDLGSFQILALLVSSIIAQSLALHLNPHKCKYNNAFSFINEYAVSVYLYIMLLLSHLNSQQDNRSIGPQLKNSLGWGLFFLLSGVVLINLVKALINDFKAIKLKIEKKITERRLVKKYVEQKQSQPQRLEVMIQGRFGENLRDLMQEEQKSDNKYHDSSLFYQDYEQNPDPYVLHYQKEKVCIPPINDLRGPFNNQELQIKKDETENLDLRQVQDYSDERYFYAWD